MDAPGWALALLGGILADKIDRRRVVAWLQSIQMLCPILIVILLITGGLHVWTVIALSLVIGATDALSMPSFQTIVPSIVERKQIGTALALSSTQFNLSRILGPAIAGVLITAIGVIACYAVSALSYLPFILVALWALPKRASRAPSQGSNPFNEPFAGLREILLNDQLRNPLTTVLITSVLCGPLITFSPLLVKSAFNGTAAQFSLVVGAFGVGGLIGGVALLSIPEQADRRRLSALFATVYGMALALAAATPWFWTLPVLLMLGGFAMSISNTSANTVLLSTAPPSVRGQVISLYMLVMRGGLALGSLMSGVSISLIGIRQGLLLNGALAIGTHLFLRRRWSGSPRPA